PKTVAGSPPDTPGFDLGWPSSQVTLSPLVPVTLTSGTMYTSPFAATHTGVISEMVILVTSNTATTANCRVGVYNATSETDSWPAGAPLYAETSNRDVSSVGACGAASTVTPCQSLVASSIAVSVGKLYWFSL